MAYKRSFDMEHECNSTEAWTFALITPSAEGYAPESVRHLIFHISDSRSTSWSAAGGGSIVDSFSS